MPDQFYPIDESLFSKRIRPILTRCRSERSFAPARGLFEELLPRVKDYAAACHGLSGRTSVETGALGEMGYSDVVWKSVVDEVLLFAADELPLLLLSRRALCYLLGGSESDVSSRDRFVPIEQVLYGSRDIVMAGCYYRPERVGWNDPADVVRLSEFLYAIDPASWRPADLAAMIDLPDDEERAEELEFVRQGWPELVELYRRAREKKQIIVCERD